MMSGRRVSRGDTQRCASRSRSVKDDCWKLFTHTTHYRCHRPPNPASCGIVSREGRRSRRGPRVQTGRGAVVVDDQRSSGGSRSGGWSSPRTGSVADRLLQGIRRSSAKLFRRGKASASSSRMTGARVEADGSISAAGPGQYGDQHRRREGLQPRRWRRREVARRHL